MFQPIVSKHVTTTMYSTTISGSCANMRYYHVTSCDVGTCVEPVNYPMITCHLITSNDNDFNDKRENIPSVTLPV